MREILIGLLPVLCVVLGAVLQHILARSKERDSQFANLRHQSYADYLRAVSAVAKTRSPDSILQLTDAKSRMAIYASDKVIELMAEIETTGPDLRNAMAKDAFGTLAAQMRLESGGGAKKESLSTVLFGAAAAVRSAAA